MRVSLNWLTEYVDIPVSPEELAERMTMLGLEIESIERPGEELKDIYVGQILYVEPHPDADKIVVCKTDVGGPEPLQICCGAKNMKVGDRVPTAVVGAVLPGNFQISRRKMRGVESQGMMCSAKELGMGEDQGGLMILDPDTPVGADIRQILGLDDVIFEIEVTPNRGDWASMIGIARELAAHFGTELRLPQLSLTESGTPVQTATSVTIEAPELCPRYLGRHLSGLNIGPSPQWLVKRLLAAGQRPINNVVDVTNYVLLETGHPLHAFDYDKLAEHRIVVRKARPGETIHTLDGQDRALTAEMLVIADAQHAQCVAGVMGGAGSEVGEGTTRIFLESAFFNPVFVRRTSRALALITESSQRFQRGADPEMAAFAIDRAAMLMQELAGATVALGVLDEYPGKTERKEVRLRYARTGRILGAEVAPETQRKYIEALGFTPAAQDAEGCNFLVPTWRHDVQHGEADLIEEIARLHGFSNIPLTLPRVRQSEQIFAPKEARVRRFRHFLVGLGLSELYSWTFSCPEDVRKAGLDGDELDMVILQNPLSEKHATMRGSLLPGLLQTAAYNLNRGLKDIAVFEIGPVYRPAPNGDLPRQELRLGLLLAGVAEPAHWSHPPREVDFHDLKGYVESILDFFGADAAFSESALATLQPGQRAAISFQKVLLGNAGKVSPAVRAAHGIDANVYLAELSLEPLLETVQAPHPFEAIPAFPPSLRDLAVVVDEQVPAGDLLAESLRVGGDLLKEMEIFDIYTGESIAPDKKSVAFSLTFQSPERTLTDKDTDKTMQKIVRSLESKFGAIQR